MSRLDLGPVHHIALLVRDLPAAEAFYAGVLGLRVERRWPESDGSLRSVWLALGNDMLLMLEKASPADAPRGDMGAGLHLLAFTIAAADRGRIEQELTRRRIAIEKRSDYTLYARDPEGNRIAFSHWPHPVPQRP